MTNQPQENQQQERARRLSEQIARMKAGRPIHRPGAPPSLREQIEARISRLQPRRTITVPKPKTP